MRNPSPNVTLACLACLVFLTATISPALAARAHVEAPTGFQLVSASTGVQLYRKNYPKGNPDFVQVVDLSQGAAIQLLHGDIVDPRQGKGVFGGDDPKLTSRALKDYWENLEANAPNAFCMTNGQFFNIQEYPTRLPFPLKVNDVILSDGYADREFEGQKLILELWPDHADITLLTQATLYLSSAPNIVGGLHEEARKSPTRAVGRTFVGIVDGNQDGLAETVLIFNTQSATQAAAAEVLRSFGASKVMMLDGGGSTQLICRNKALITSDRLLPQVIGILAGDALAVEATATLTPTHTQPPPTAPPASPNPPKTQEAFLPGISPTGVLAQATAEGQPEPGADSTAGVRPQDALVILLVVLVVAPGVLLLALRIQKKGKAIRDERGRLEMGVSLENDEGEEP